MNVDDYIKLIASLSVDLKKARAFQINLSKEVILAEIDPVIRTIAGIDVSYRGNEGFVGAVVVDLNSSKIIKKYTARCIVTCDYISTFLFLRELPPLLKIFNVLKHVDCFFIDGHGLAHPYYAGLAVMFGVITNKCTVGVAKSPLKGFKLYSTTIGGKYEQILLNNKLVGIALRSTPHHKTIFVSPGHKASIISSLRLVEKMLRKDKRLPIPLHYAHIVAERFKQRSS